MIVFAKLSDGVLNLFGRASQHERSQTGTDGARQFMGSCGTVLEQIIPGHQGDEQHGKDCRTEEEQYQSGDDSAFETVKPDMFHSASFNSVSGRAIQTI